MKEYSPEVIRDAASKYGLSSVNASVLNYVGNAITVNMGGVGTFNQSNPLYDSEIDAQFHELMSIPRYQMLYQDLLKARKNHYLKWRHDSLNKKRVNATKKGMSLSQTPTKYLVQSNSD